MTLEIHDYAAAFGRDGDTIKCVILSPKGLPDDGQDAITARTAQLANGDLILFGAQGRTVLKAFPEALRAALDKGLPLLMLDPERQVEHLIELIAGPLTPPAGNPSLPPGFFG